ncbi:MAG: TIGR03118 family protein [Candidatus Polarisedimenticolia bacterium]
MITWRAQSRFVAIATVALLTLTPATHLTAAPPESFYRQTNLVSDQPGVALIQDPDLVNPWGIALSPTGGAFWVANNVTGKATTYIGDVSGSVFSKAALVVAIPGGAPTGTVFNPTTDFVVSAAGTSGTAFFLFASQAGIISGWSPGVPPPAPSTTAQIGATFEVVYTGLAIGQTAGGANMLYAADFENNKIDVYDASFHLVHLDGSFTDPDLKKGYSPFNIQNLGGELYVAYAQQSNKEPDEESGHGTGFVNVFDTDGHLLRQLIRNSHLVAPWALALAPGDFGPFSNALLVGNFGNGRVLAFDPANGDFLGFLEGEDGKPIEIDGLWGLAFGNGASAGDSNALYFAAGPDDETHGLFGSLRFVGP